VRLPKAGRLLASLTFLLVLGSLSARPLRAQDTFKLTNAAVGTPYHVALKTEGGIAPLHWQKKSGDLPPGISLSPDGVLDGTPTQGRIEPFTFELEVSDSSPSPQVSIARFALFVPPKLRIVDPNAESQPLKITDPAKDAQPAAEAAGNNAGNRSDTSAAKLSADPPDRATIDDTLHEWNYMITGKLPASFASATETKIEIRVDDVPENPSKKIPGNPLIDAAGGKFTVWLDHPLQEGQGVRVRPVKGNTAGDWSDEVVVKKQDNAEKNDCPTAVSDCRDAFEASAYIGLGIDTFASGETNKYLNPNAPNGPKERMVGGLDFAYRLMGQPTVHFGEERHGWPNQLWVYGETVHGVRSADVDCTKNPTFLPCQTALALPTRGPDQILFTIRNATSLEGFAGFRYEFLSLQPRTLSPANLYMKAQAGFLTAVGTPSAAKALHQVGLGAIVTKGLYEDSYLEAGFGRNDLFAENRLSRWKVDAFLSRRLGRGVSFFVQLNVDTDIGPGSDSIQTYLGFDLDLRRFHFFRDGDNSKKSKKTKDKSTIDASDGNLSTASATAKAENH
jgi:hypothetical protein